MATKRTKETKKTTPKVSYHYKPDNMTPEQWQIALRRQAAEKENFGISEMNAKEYPGYYAVNNPVSHNLYRVVYRGAFSAWNYCSCMDFKTSQLGTCKHIEAVKFWIGNNHKRVHTGTPAYTSVYLSYRRGREVRIRIGSDHAEAFRQLAEPYFTPKDIMRPEAIDTITDFFRQALALDNTFRWYEDAMDFIVEQRDKQNRERFLAAPPQKRSWIPCSKSVFSPTRKKVSVLPTAPAKPSLPTRWDWARPFRP